MKRMRRLLLLLPFASLLALAQHKTAPAGPPPADTASPVQAALVKDGVRLLKEDGSTLCELWLRAQEPSGGKAEPNASFQTIPHGAFLGLIRFPARHYDRRGQTIKPGLYTLRYALYPVNGDHQGAAPQRDFLILSPAAIDADPAALPAFDDLMSMSTKASGTPHPLALSFWKSDASATEGFAMEGDTDGVLRLKLGTTLVSVILIGKHEG